jgi:hypothetical protein
MRKKNIIRNNSTGPGFLSKTFKILDVNKNKILIFKNYIFLFFK